MKPVDFAEQITLVLQGQEQIYEQLVELKGLLEAYSKKFADTERRLDMFEGRLRERIADHEIRIAKMES